MAIATALCLVVHGCATVDGGAVELSWKLRPTSSSLPDQFVECDSGKPDTNPVTHIRLEWSVRTGATSVVTGHDQWPCTDNHGVTGFDLPAGTALLAVRPRCGPAGSVEDALPASYIAPAPEQRTVEVGQTVSLGAVEIVVNVTYCGDQPCICRFDLPSITPDGKPQRDDGAPLASEP
jgi:hypothetical protein